MPPVTTSAATTVFDLPELLENLLLCVSTSADDGVMSHRVPAKDLFVFQRVNSCFQATITRNKTMRQRMFLEPRPESVTDTLANPQDSFQWLLNNIRVSVGGRELVGNIGALRVRLSPDETGPSSTKTRKEASWRQMKLHCIDSCGPLHMAAWGLPFQGEGRTFDQKESITLGQVYNGLQKLLPLVCEYGQATVSSNPGMTRNILLVSELERTGRRVGKALTRDDLWE
jgi:hypothetical protein